MTENKILALKYRPQKFDDLIGQEILAKTITNAIKLGKTPNAYLLTGIRGVGKTTTARLIAKELNCLANLNDKLKCTPEKFCETCKEIVNSSHMDILEMDAASKTGIDDVRELIENSKYSPTSAQYKIFIIDEVHMLSKQAFNGLLKTLEEPPPRLKFILATTEVRKIPVTILSRCQRFDLKRVSLDKLLEHLKKISNKEKGKISINALKLITRASEGSVRDAISLLDRALVSQNINKNSEVQDTDIRSMLGLADRSKIINLFKEVLLGNQVDATNHLKEMINNGLDAKNFLNDILEILYLFSRRVNLGPITKDMMISENEIKLIDEYAQNLNMQDLGLFWQLTIKTIDDLKIVSNENLALEMYIMQLIHLKKIDLSSETNNEIGSLSETKVNKNNETLEKESSKKEINGNIKSQMKSIEQIKEKINKITEPKLEIKSINKIKTFNEIIALADKENEIELKYDLERNVKLVSFDKCKIDITFNEKLNKNFIKNLTEKLLKWTGERWVISLSKNKGAKSVYDQRKEKEITLINKEEKSEIAKKIFNSFPDAKLSKVKGEHDA